MRQIAEILMIFHWKLFVIFVVIFITCYVLSFLVDLLINKRFGIDIFCRYFMISQIVLFRGVKNLDILNKKRVSLITENINRATFITNCSGLILYVNIWKILLWHHIEAWHSIDYMCIHNDTNLVLFSFSWLGANDIY